MPNYLSVLNTYFSLLQDGDFLRRHVGRQFVLQVVYLDKLAVQFLLVGMKLEELLRPMFPVGINQVGQAVRTFACFLAEADEFVFLEVPRGFVGVPVGTGDSNILLSKFCYSLFIMLYIRNLGYFT